MRKLTWLIAMALAALTPGCEDDDNGGLPGTESALTDTQVASLQGQIDAINSSMAKLEGLGDELSGYVETLRQQAAGLETATTENEQEIGRVERELSQSISAEKANVLALLNGVAADAEEGLERVREEIGELESRDSLLERELEALRAHVDGLPTTGDEAALVAWANGTFATLERFDSLGTVVAGVKVGMESLNSSLAALEERVNRKIETDIANAITALRTEFDKDLADGLAETAGKVTEAYTEAIGTARAEITTAYTSSIQTAIGELAESMKSWVNEQLTGYYTMAETDAKLDAVKADLEQQLEASRAYLETLITDLDKELSTQIGENGRLIAALREDLTALSGTVAENTAAITKNTESIQEHARQIAANSQSIAANREDIDANAALIAENKQLIDKNAGLIAANQEAIRTLQGEMSAAQADILANAAAIVENASDISKNAGLIASNAAAIADNLAAITANTADITQLKTDLEVAKTDLTAAYTAAIEKAITELDGKIEGELATEVASLNSRITNEVAAIDNKITTLTGRVTAVETSVAEIQEAITGIRTEISELQARLEELM